MDITKPIDIDRPEWPDIPYDYRNQQKAGKYRGVGIPGKIGFKNSSTNTQTMPQKPHTMGVPRAED